ncbi:MAG TPA: SatD family protein [Candidatus Atribacteria bacterium]|nr:SatD family protein [Candidatus Atribacteria bacterium]
MPSPEEKFAALTADIIGSRKLKNQGFSRSQIEKAISQLNTAREAFIVSKFCLLRGDEIQGVVFPPREAIVMVRYLRFYLRPVQIRVGIGIGDITTEIDKNNPWNMDGSSFHRAREALEEIKLSRHPATFINSLEEDFDYNLNVILALMDVISNRWTDGQWEAIHAYEQMGTYQKASQVLKVRPQNVAKRCQSAHWKVFSEAEKHIQKLIDLKFPAGEEEKTGWNSPG